MEGGMDIGQAGIGWVVKSYRSDLVQPKSFQIKYKQKVIDEHEIQQAIAKGM